jgi:hypothetical protein
MIEQSVLQGFLAFVAFVVYVAAVALALRVFRQREPALVVIALGGVIFLAAVPAFLLACQSMNLWTRLVNLASGQRLHYYNGLPLYLRRDVMRFHVEATGLGYQAEFLLRLLQEGRSYIEVPMVASDRGGSTALNLRNFISVGYRLQDHSQAVSQLA